MRQQLAPRRGAHSPHCKIPHEVQLPVLQDLRCIISRVFRTNPKLSPISATLKKFNSIQAQTGIFCTHYSIPSSSCFDLWWKQLWKYRDVFVIVDWCLPSQGFLVSSCHPTCWRCTRSWDGWPQLIKEIFQTIWCHALHINMWKKDEGHVWSSGLCLPKSAFHLLEPYFPGVG